MSKDLVQRLRDQSSNPWAKNWELCLQAAARIEADAALLRQALEALSHHRNQGRPCVEQAVYDAIRARLGETA